MGMRRSSLFPASHPAQKVEFYFVVSPTSHVDESVLIWVTYLLLKRM